jgi:sulfopyruvate decarboxylase alpha subunit
MALDEESSDTVQSRIVFDSLIESGVNQFAYVPDAGHATTINLAHETDACTTTTLTTEEEGIPYLLGNWLGGQRGVLLMQSSGVGNCINMLALSVTTRTPLLMIVTMRGEWAEFNPWQVPMGQATEAILNEIGVKTWRADKHEDLEPLVKGACTMAFEAGFPCAVLIGQKLLGAKQWTR